MAKNLTRKILEAHLVEGRLQPGEEIGIRIDQASTAASPATGSRTRCTWSASVARG
jgi:aconitate hydratase